MTEIMKQIIAECKSQNMTQRELAERSGVTEASTSRYFNGERTPNIKKVEKMARALGLKLALIMGDTRNEQ